MIVIMKLFLCNEIFRSGFYFNNLILSLIYAHNLSKKSVLYIRITFMSIYTHTCACTYTPCIHTLYICKVIDNFFPAEQWLARAGSVSCCVCFGRRPLEACS